MIADFHCEIKRPEAKWECLQMAKCSGSGMKAIAVSIFSLAAAGAMAADKVDFNADVRPVLSHTCFHCHGADESSRKAELRLDLPAEAMKQRKGTTPVVPGSPEKSDAWRRITSTDLKIQMPPPDSKISLKPQEIETLGRWIKQGAVYAKHWAFEPPKLPAVPKIADGAVAKNPIDNFVVAKLPERGLKQNPEADRNTLIRRLSLDIIGLPPTREEVEAFVSDKSPDAYEKTVDRLLASSHYGEKWARMWLDVARYADSTGYGSDQLRLYMWPYRDWVINSFNANMGYDEFTIEQLAGDLLPDATVQQKLATAFHRQTMMNTEGGTDDEEYRVAAVKDRVNTTMQAWMGLTAGCAQCHTHKFDPITHKEYYQLFAIFNQTEDADRSDDAPRIPAPAGEDAQKKPKTVEVPVMKEREKNLRVSHILAKGNYLAPTDEVRPALLASFNPGPTNNVNRLALAKWLLAPDNPTTARVAVNRFWAQLFGAGIVETEEDFGTQGSQPINQELLDWLAVTFRSPKSEGGLGWDMKALIKVIVSSQTYRQSSVASDAAQKNDPRNHLVSHYPRRRLEAEAIRDQALSLAGLLSPRIGGPSVYPPQPGGLWVVAFRGAENYPTSTGEDRWRRGLYTIWRRIAPNPTMFAFDAPSREICTVRRLPTNTPLQSFVTLNDPVYVEAAQAFARRIVRDAKGDARQKIKWALETTLARPATETQIAALATLLEKTSAQFHADADSARKLATSSELPLPPGADAAELAAWTTVANVLLNLDGVLTRS